MAADPARQSASTTSTYLGPLTRVNVLVHRLGNLAVVHGRHGLRLERLAVLARLEHARVVHGALQRVALPPKEVVGVRREALAVARAEHKLAALGDLGVIG